MAHIVLSDPNPRRFELRTHTHERSQKFTCRCGARWHLRERDTVIETVTPALDCPECIAAARFLSSDAGQICTVVIPDDTTPAVPAVAA